jgi:hypothetical protein
MYNPLNKLNPFDKTGNKVDVLTGVIESRIDLLPPKDFTNKFFNVQQWTEMPSGGHFAAMEQPELLADDIRKFVYNITIQEQLKEHLEYIPG